jgi:hypothetical protein
MGESLFMKKSKSLFGRLQNGGLYLRHPVDAGGAFAPLRGRTDSPKYTEAEQILCALCAISVERTVLICVHLWLKISQSKITNYTKQTQFPKGQK